MYCHRISNTFWAKFHEKKLGRSGWKFHSTIRSRKIEKTIVPIGVYFYFAVSSLISSISNNSHKVKLQYNKINSYLSSTSLAKASLINLMTCLERLEAFKEAAIIKSRLDKGLPYKCNPQSSPNPFTANIICVSDTCSSRRFGSAIISFLKRQMFFLWIKKKYLKKMSFSLYRKWSKRVSSAWFK